MKIHKKHVSDIMHRGVVVCESDLPASTAARMMAAHRIHSVVVMSPAGVPRVVTDVEMKPLSPDEIALYVASGEPMDKAGAYAIQGGAAPFIVRSVGSYSNVVGLPVDEVIAVLERHGLGRSRD